MLLGFIGRQRLPVFGFGVARLLKLVMGLEEISVGHNEVMARSCMVEMGVDSDGFCYGFLMG